MTSPFDNFLLADAKACSSYDACRERAFAVGGIAQRETSSDGMAIIALKRSALYFLASEIDSHTKLCEQLLADVRRRAVLVEPQLGTLATAFEADFTQLCAAFMALLRAGAQPVS